MHSSIEAIIFDVGGVLAYDQWEHLYLDEETGLASRFGLPTKRLEEVGLKLWKEFDLVPASAERPQDLMEREYWARFLEEFRGDMPLSVSVDQLIEISLPFIRDVNNKEMIPLLEELEKKNLKLGICSNNNEFWFYRQMHVTGLRRFFPPRNDVLSCRVGVPKSHPSGGMFLAVFEALQLKGEKAFFIDDRNPNIERARAFGLNGVLVPRESTEGVKVIRRALKEQGVL